MGDTTRIEWADATFNPWIGCTKVSPACKNCYAERDFDVRLKTAKWGPSGTRVVTSDGNWRKPLAWNREAEKTGIRKRVFCASLADVFEDWRGVMLNHRGATLYSGWHHSQPDWVASVEPCEGEPLRMDAVRRRLFDLIDATTNLDWLLLTKRPENIPKMWPVEFGGIAGFQNEARIPYVRKNVWLGTSVENQEWADKRIPQLLNCRDLSPVLWLSCEPLVGPVDLRSRVPVKASPGDHDYGGYTLWNSLTGFRTHKGGGWTDDQPKKIDWVITGGESGPDARPCDPDWFRSLRDQCVPAGVPFHFKQWGEWGDVDQADPIQVNNATYHVLDKGRRVFRVGKKNAGRLLDGVEHNGVPCPVT